VAPWILAAAWAQTSTDQALQRRWWQSKSAERTAVDLREPAAVSYFNLTNGYMVRSPFWVEFGIRGLGLVPAGNAQDRAGHHHILVDRPLPAKHQEKIPFDDPRRHFGTSQTGAALDLPPGKHTLRLLFADHEYRPHFAISRETTLHAVGKRTDAEPRIDERNFDATCTAWYRDAVTAPRTAASGVYAKNVRDGR